MHRHNMVGVINTQDLGYHPYYASWQTNDVIQYHRYDIFHISLLYSLGYNNSGSVLGIITRPAVNC